MVAQKCSWNQIIKGTATCRAVVLDYQHVLMIRPNLYTQTAEAGSQHWPESSCETNNHTPANNSMRDVQWRRHTGEVPGAEWQKNSPLQCRIMSPAEHAFNSPDNWHTRVCCGDLLESEVQSCWRDVQFSCHQHNPAWWILHNNNPNPAECWLQPQQASLSTVACDN